jgi:hypothetical protein
VDAVEDAVRLILDHRIFLVTAKHWTHINWDLLTVDNSWCRVRTGVLQDCFTAAEVCKLLVAARKVQLLCGATWLTTKKFMVPGVCAGMASLGHCQWLSERPSAARTESSTMSAITAAPAAPAITTAWAQGRNVHRVQSHAPTSNRLRVGF